MRNSIVFSLFCSTLTVLGCSGKSSKDSATEPSIAAAPVSVDSAICSELMELHGAEEAQPGYTFSETKVFQVRIDWSSPLVAGELNNSARLKFLQKHGEAMPLSLNSFKLFMPAMGHGSIKTDKLILTQDLEDTSSWKVQQIYFSMPGGAGDWVVDLAVSACGISDKFRVVIPGEVK
jgi:hypothetical protein